MCERESPNVTPTIEIRNRDDTDLPVCDLKILKAPVPLQSILQMSANAQQPRRPNTNDREPRRVLRCRLFVLAVQYRDGAASDPKREVPIADQLAREHDDRGGMTEEHDPFVRPGEAPLHFGDKDSQEARDAVVHGWDALALARRVPHRGPGIVDLGKVGLQGARRRRARVQQPCSRLDRVVPLGHTCHGWEGGGLDAGRHFSSRVSAHHVRHRSEGPAQSPWISTFADSDLGSWLLGNGPLDQRAALTVRGGKYSRRTLVFR